MPDPFKNVCRLDRKQLDITAELTMIYTPSQCKEITVREKLLVQAQTDSSEKNQHCY